MPTGTVKWFSDDKGFGFITPDDGDKDLFVHHTGINGEGYRSLQEGAKVSYDAEQGEKGPKAVNVADDLSRRCPQRQVKRARSSSGPFGVAGPSWTTHGRPTRQRYPSLAAFSPRAGRGVRGETSRVRPALRMASIASPAYTLVDEPAANSRARLRSGRGGTRRARRAERGWIVLVCDQPSEFAHSSSRTRTGEFPRWLAGPFGGVCCRAHPQRHDARGDVFTTGSIDRYVRDRVHVRDPPYVPSPARTLGGQHAIARGAPNPVPALPAAVAHRCLQLHQLRAHGGGLSPQPLRDDPDLRAALRSARSFLLSNWHELLSPYGPLFTLLTFALVPLGVAGDVLGGEGHPRVSDEPRGCLYLVWRCARAPRSTIRCATSSSSD